MNGPAVIFDRQPPAGHGRIVPFGIGKPRSSSSGVHRCAPGALDLERPDIALTAGDSQSVVEHFARLVRCLVANGSFQQLDPLAVRLEPGAGDGVEGADLPFDLCRGCRQSIRASALSILDA